MIMMNLADPPPLVAYGKFIKDLATQFGPVCWPLIYQADSRMRREYLETIRRDQSAALDAAIQAGGSTDFDPKRPWNACFDAAVDCGNYWRRNVEIPSILIVAKARAASNYLDGDAPVASTGMHLATGQAHASDLGITTSALRGSGSGRRADPPAPPSKGADKTIENFYLLHPFVRFYAYLINY